jgi:hypothetical protein
MVNDAGGWVGVLVSADEHHHACHTWLARELAGLSPHSSHDQAGAQ